jgi:hypothetical protein
MKTVRSFTVVLMMILLLSGFTSELQAQGRGNGKGQGNNKENHPGRGHNKSKPHSKGHDKYDRDRGSYDHNHHNQWSHGHRDTRQYHQKRYVTYNHHRHGAPLWAPAYGHRYNTRYIYYRDYNVYYDCHRDVFLTWSGRHWVVTARVPDVICHVDFRRAMVVGVDYWGDDFNFYLERKRPSYVSISASW